MQIYYANTLGNVFDLLRKISKLDIQNGDQEIVPMKQHFIIAREISNIFFFFFFFFALWWRYLCMFYQIQSFLDSKFVIFCGIWRLP